MKSVFPLILMLAAGSVALRAAERAASSRYPLNTCVVSGEALDSMGETYVHTYQEEGKPAREVRFCCKGCLKKFNREPAKYLGRLDAAAKDAKPTAPAADDTHSAHGH